MFILIFSLLDVKWNLCVRIFPYVASSPGGNCFCLDFLWDLLFIVIINSSIANFSLFRFCSINNFMLSFYVGNYPHAAILKKCYHHHYHLHQLYHYVVKYQHLVDLILSKLSPWFMLVMKCLMNVLSSSRKLYLLNSFQRGIHKPVRHLRWSFLQK